VKVTTDHEFRVGDVIGFSGSDLISRAIKLATVPPWYWLSAHWRCVSHVGICVHWHDKTVMVESTTFNNEPCIITKQKIKGVQAHLPRERVENYPGYVFRMRLDERWRFNKWDAKHFSSDVLSYIGFPYDTLGAIRSATDVPAYANHKRQFCSKVVSAALARANRLPLSNSNSYTPSGLMHRLYDVETYDEGIRLK